MGVASLASNQFFQRFLMFFMQPSKYPDEPHTKFMAPKRMHLFTGIQLGLFVILTVFRSISVIAIAFPIVIKACIPVRMYMLPRYFTEEELIMIDTDDSIVDEYLSYKESRGEKIPVRHRGQQEPEEVPMVRITEHPNLHVAADDGSSENSDDKV